MSGIGPAGPAASVANGARVWNYWIGGRDNYTADQRVGEQVAGMLPVIREVARADRAFLGRAVRLLADGHGVRQFLDIGTGLPTVENTHEIAQGVAPESRIVYVDNDPMVLMYARTLLTSSPEGVTDYVDADVHDPDTIVRRAAGTLDLTRPVAVMMLGILNFVLDTDTARAVVRRIMAAVPSGSFLVLTHPTVDAEAGGQGNIEAVRFWNDHATPPVTARTHAEIAGFLDGLELLEPGLVPCSKWRAGTDSPAPVPQFGAVAVKP
ncbi:O-methyltransferase involved in polyketide biosynthesis [Streptomyces sp. Ag109_O5-1]|uniref:SAM-dependent methyltransferase n=1 Tax=Streptomyces sp. Ag109_O5-1 TaxID=1938851 RepID=UPI000F4EF1A3|nr:SAM-dependent methyltransferase [Streptomyces sp. Ag109_O5-1]RPE38190.1 O-methyltransferase involved in polyketide biosynthesis [Streptomyces sp. Ag109_O5-1]